MGGVDFSGQLNKAVPNGLSGFNGNLLPHDAARQSGERITPGLQTSVAVNGDQALHHPIFLHEVFASLIPVVRRKNRQLRNRNSGQQQSPGGLKAMFCKFRLWSSWYRWARLSTPPLGTTDRCEFGLPLQSLWTA